MKDFQSFIKAMEKSDIEKSTAIVLTNLNKNDRVDLVFNLLKITAPSYHLGIENLEKTISSFRKGKISDLDLGSKILDIRSTSSRLGMFGTASASILADLKSDDIHHADHAVRTINYHLISRYGEQKADKILKEFLANASTYVWPNKTIFGAIYG